jgi:hypothetical protein
MHSCMRISGVLTADGSVNDKRTFRLQPNPVSCRNLSLFALRGCRSTYPSASIAVYRLQAEISGGKFDGKSDAPLEDVSYFQVLIRAGDN